MEKYKHLLKNIGVLTISQFGTKFLTFLLVPLYTNILTTKEYGIYDIFTTTIQLLMPILTLNITEATLRFTLDKNNNRKDVFSISCKYIIDSFLIIFLFLIANKIFMIFPSISKYSLYFLMLYILSTINNLLTFYARGICAVTEVAISGVISSVVLISLNILFLVTFHLGLKGYFLANIIGFSAQSIYLIFKIQCWKYFKVTNLNNILKKEMIDYSKPMIANSIAWWINNASDRYIVTLFCGFASNGIYSVGYKIPSILNIFQTIFNQAWTLSAVQDFDEKDSNQFFSRIYNVYNFCMTTICSLLIICSRIMAYILYAKDFF